MLKRFTRRRALTAGAALVAAAALGAGAAVGITAAVDGSGQTATAPAITVQPAAATAELDASELYARTAPGVVEITVTGTSEGFGPYGPREVESQGSGFVLDTKGNIVTNQHVVSGASSITVTFGDGMEAEATLVGSDASTDVAVIRVDVAADKLHPLVLGSSADVEPGDGVVAIGSPFGLEGSISAGIVSAVDRTITAPDGAQITGAIQTDAALNKGNSGGPLIDATGKVIGVNSQIESGTDTGTGVGFAIPIDTVRTVASQLIASGKVEHGFLGVHVVTVTTTAAERLGLPRGAQVAEVEARSPAAKGDLKAGTETQTVNGVELTEDGDVIVAIDGTAVTSGDQLAAAIAAHEPGDTVALTVVRDGDQRTVSVTLGSR